MPLSTTIRPGHASGDRLVIEAEGAEQEIAGSHARVDGGDRLLCKHTVGVIVAVEQETARCESVGQCPRRKV